MLLLRVSHKVAMEVLTMAVGSQECSAWGGASSKLSHRVAAKSGVHWLWARNSSLTCRPSTEQLTTWPLAHLRVSRKMVREDGREGSRNLFVMQSQK